MKLWTKHSKGSSWVICTGFSHSYFSNFFVCSLLQLLHDRQTEKKEGYNHALQRICWYHLVRYRKLLLSLFCDAMPVEPNRPTHMCIRLHSMTANVPVTLSSLELSLCHEHCVLLPSSHNVYTSNSVHLPFVQSVLHLVTMIPARLNLICDEF